MHIQELMHYIRVQKDTTTTLKGKYLYFIQVTLLITDFTDKYFSYK